jgi:hypothetical protein
MKFIHVLGRLNRWLCLPYLPICISVIVLFLPTLISGRALFWGTPLLQFVPWWSYAFETLKAGHLPLWNPMVGMGAPLVANYQSALFYPPNWLLGLLYIIGGVPVLAWGQTIIVLLHLIFAGIGMAVLTRQLGLNKLAQTISGLAYGLSGYLLARAGFLSFNAATAWLPWVIVCLTPGGINPLKSQYMYLIGCLSMLILAGHAQTTWYIFFLAFLWTSYWTWKRGDDPEKKSQAIIWIQKFYSVVHEWLKLAVAIIIACCITALQLFPTIEYLSQSQRASAVDFELAMTYSFWPWRLLTFLAPDFFGNPAHGDYWGYGNYWEDAGYIGLLPLLLAIFALVYSIKSNLKTKNERQDKIQEKFPELTLFLLLILIAIFLLALGNNTPVFPWLYHHLPTFNLFQAPTRIMLLFEFILALLAGIGVSNWFRPKGRALYWTRLGTAGAVSIAIGAGVAWYRMGDVSPTFIYATAQAGMWGVGAGLLTLTAPKRENSAQPHNINSWKINLWQWTVIGFVMLNLVTAGWGLNPTTSLEIYKDSPTAIEIREIVNNHRIYMPAVVEHEIKFVRFLRFDTFYPEENWQNLRSVILPNTNILDGLRSVNNFDPVVPGRYARWMNALTQVDPGMNYLMMTWMDIGVVERIEKNVELNVRFYPLQGSYHVWWAECSLLARSPDDAWEMVFNDINIQSQVVIEGKEPVDGPICSNHADKMIGLSDESVDIHEDGPNRIVVHVNSPDVGWLVFSDTWYPGWKVSVNGKLTHLYPANYLFRAVPVNQGSQKIIFKYQPSSFLFGVMLSLLSVVTVIFINYKSVNWPFLSK